MSGYLALLAQTERDAVTIRDLRRELDAQRADALTHRGRPADAEILSLAHRMATTYAHRSDPKYHRYAFVPHTLIAFVRAVLGAGQLKDLGEQP